MKKVYYFTAIVTMAFYLTGCSKTNYLEVDPQIIQEKIYDPTATKYEGLQSSIVLYLDNSTCVIDARDNSKVFNALRPQLGQYCDTLRLIKGDVFETIPLNRSDNKVFAALQTIHQDIPNANILRAVEQICNDKQQTILITDCEFFQNGLNHDQDPYLTEPFKYWLEKGHSIYIVVEPYKEKNNGKIYNKKRFYFFFTDDRTKSPIIKNMLNEFKPFLQDSLCRLFKLTNSDISVKRVGDIVDNNLDFNVVDKNGFEFVSIDNSWKEIRQYVMNLDEHGNLLPDGKPVPFIKNLVFNNMEDYDITDMKIIATNVTSQYLGLEDKSITPNNIDMSGCFKLDKNALKEHKLNVMLTDKIFDFISNDYGGNLIRLDFVVNEAAVKNYDANMFVWQSMINHKKAICVSQSIDNVLNDIKIVPTNNDRKIIYSVFIKTEAYK